jgi:NarL family two-component system response regulator YdfI
MTRVLIVSPLVAASRELARALGDEGSLTVVGVRRSEHSLDAAVATLAPDVVLFERWERTSARTPLLVGLEAAGGAPAAVALVDRLDARSAAAALARGARAVLPRAAPVGEIVAAVHLATRGLTTLPSDIAAGLVADAERDGPREPAAAAAHPLTPRETEILAMLAEGLGNKTIALRLGISGHTVKTHLGSIFEKLGAANRAEAVATGLRRGLLML